MAGTPLFYPSSPIEIRDGTAQRLMSITALKNVYKQRTIPTKDDALPFAAVWHAGERTEPNGDANVGAPSFMHTLTLVVDIMTRAASETALDASIVGLAEMVRATLMTDGTWVELFEGIERCDLRYSYPKETNDIVCQAMIEFEVTFRSEWPPVAPNDFLQVAVSTNALGAQPPFLNDLTTQFDIPDPAP